MGRTPVLAATAFLAAAALAACGTTDPATDSTGGDTQTAGSAAGPVTVTDAAGEEVTLEAPAEDVVALEWNQAEMVTTLGVDLVGLSDVEGYTSWVGTSEPLRNEPRDVGTRREPSIEAIAELEPDLIIGSPTSIPEDAIEQIERIAPVVLLQSADGADPLGTMRSSFETVATLLGKEAEAEQELADFDATLAENAAAIDEAGLTGTPVVLTSPYAEGSTLSIRMHGPRSSVQAVALELGLASAWEDPGDDGYGLSNIDLEGLTELPDDTQFLYWGNDGEDDPVETSMAGNPLWEELPFVQAGQVHEVAVGIWAYGGPASMAAWSDDLVRALGA
ncbi:iron-siderophore ABC transporter substrate-binding protein [Myceligenerans pegani]|uniref:Iron-siderophore ABC transporter substrate-binding protein n=1 Tax=Myceligenerans pegani TaxID=2776917 RepID=A0ABR9N433_9MICO|nr:iron-siderophore ABC transporter substrate-binding protein [Myceligenerans sp. TRM 65318]MBE1878429.1 iron-siderophore ABC transporter substrate-binding protein [Myceligenerans sp. TRM 65318]MBE3020700.1 iron-siderophore ABC transporter substrate-binding protein [Myceligenerans sp. TRM 65318]